MLINNYKWWCSEGTGVSGVPAGTGRSVLVFNFYFARVALIGIVISLYFPFKFAIVILIGIVISPLYIYMSLSFYCPFTCSVCPFCYFPPLVFPFCLLLHVLKIMCIDLHYIVTLRKCLPPTHAHACMHTHIHTHCMHAHTHIHTLDSSYKGHLKLCGR